MGCCAEIKRATPSGLRFGFQQLWGYSEGHACRKSCRAGTRGREKRTPGPSKSGRAGTTRRRRTPNSTKPQYHQPPISCSLRSHRKVLRLSTRCCPGRDMSLLALPPVMIGAERRRRKGGIRLRDDKWETRTILSHLWRILYPKQQTPNSGPRTLGVTHTSAMNFTQIFSPSAGVNQEDHAFSLA